MALARARTLSCPSLGPTTDTRDLDLDFHDLVTEPLTYPSLFFGQPSTGESKNKRKSLLFLFKGILFQDVHPSHLQEPLRLARRLVCSNRPGLSISLPLPFQSGDLHDRDELGCRQDHTHSRRQDVRCNRKQDGAMNGCCEDDAGRNVGPDQTRHTSISGSTTRHGHRLEPSWQQFNMVREPARLSSVNPPNLHSNYQILQNLEPYLTPFASFHRRR